MLTNVTRTKARRWLYGLSALAALCNGCGSSDPPHTPQALPQLAYRGGTVLAAPQIVNITFAGDPLASQLQTFGASITSSAWWDEVRAGYCNDPTSCVGKGSSIMVQLATPAEAMYTDSVMAGPSSLRTWLASAIASKQLPAPMPGGVSNTVYVIYFPQTTSISVDGASSCSVTNPESFGGYHATWNYQPNAAVPYVVVAQCEPMAPLVKGIAPTTLLQETTIAASHEIIEAASDPNPPTGYALDDTTRDNFGWIDVTGGGEAADLCVDFFGLNKDQTDSGGFTVQTIWSNARAAAGLDPCLPALPGEVYFNAAPRQSFFMLKVGDSTTFDVDTFSSAPTNDWILTAADFSHTTSTEPYLTFSIEGGTESKDGPSIRINAGRTVRVKVTLNKDPGDLDTTEADGVILSISGDAGRGPAAHIWPFAVISTTNAAAVGPGTKITRRAGKSFWALHSHGLERFGLGVGASSKDAGTWAAKVSP